MGTINAGSWDWVTDNRRRHNSRCAMSTISSLGMDGHLTNSAGNILMTSTDAQK